jgi:predicted protein tyrosine phosphatase
MPAIHVCSLARLPSVAAYTGASHVATLINAATPVPRPATIEPSNHLFLGFNDITEPMEGLTPPGQEHVEQLIAFARGWQASDTGKPMIVHCFAGISRSTAGAYIVMNALRPTVEPEALAQHLRKIAPSATPNIRLVRFADALLNREGRMVAAIEAIGRGRDAFEGEPFALKLAEHG